MGRRFAGRPSGQHSDLINTPRSDTVFRVVVLVLLAVDGVLCAVVASLFLPSYLGPYWFPISALIAGLVNAALVWGASNYALSARQSALPLITWVLTIGLLTLGGPGGDIVMAGAGIAGYGVLLLLVVGAAPAGWLLWRRSAARKLNPEKG